MKRRTQSEQRERLWHASLRAEDDAVAYLHKFDPAVALATACSVEQTLATKWEVEQEEMRRRHDPSKVMCLTDRQRSELHSALVKIPPGIKPHGPAEQRLLQILKDLPPDRAWWVSHLVVRYQDAYFGRSQLPADREQRADVPICELVAVPEAIRRAAARASSDCRETQR
jgi:hypothetical protein